MKVKAIVVTVLLVASNLSLFGFEGGTELDEKRSYFTRTWTKEDGKYVTEFSTTPMCYKDGFGEWQIIPPGDSTLTEISCSRVRSRENRVSV